MRATSRRVRARLAVLGLAAAMAMSTTGCSLLSGGSSGGDAGSGTKPKIEMGADGHVKDAIATATTPYQGYKIQVDVVSLTTYDKVTRLVFVVKPVSSGSQDALDDGTFGSKDDINGDASAVSLIDTKNLKEYDTLSAGEYCACSYVSSDGFPLDQPTTLYADYPAIPDSVDSVNVLLPKVGPIPNVKVSS